MIDPYYISLIVVIAGAFVGMVAPYLIKCREDDEITFDFSYFYTLLVTMFVSAIALVPANITPSPQYYISLFLAGLGLQTVMAKAKQKR